MPNKCKTCAHPQSAEINKLIASNLALPRIASEFGLNIRTLQDHAKNHVKPLIQKANKLAEERIVTQVLSYRKEVNYSHLDKVKFLQDKILGLLDDDSLEVGECVPLLRGFRGALQEEFKLSGAYTDNKPNDDELSQLRDQLEKLAQRQGTDYKTELRLFLEDFSDNLRADIKTKLANDLVN